MSLVGIGLSAGTGERAYPLSRRGRGYVKSKALIPFLGRSTIKWVFDDFKSQGITEYHMIVKGEENYEQIKRAVALGERRGLKIGYSRVEDDDTNTGSGDALLTNLDKLDLTNTALVFPIDSIYDLDLKAAYEFHKNSEAIVTIAGFDCDASSILGKYGFIIWNGKNMVTGFGEKPKSYEDMMVHYPNVDPKDVKNLTLFASAGLYIIDSQRLRKIGSSETVKKMREKRFDIGTNLMPWLVDNGYPVYAFRISRYGDLGTPYDYLKTLERCLSGEFKSIERIGLGNVYNAERRLFIDETSLEAKDRKTGKSLLKKIEDGDVALGSNVRIGNSVLIYPGVKLDNCNISDDTTLFEDASISRSELNERCLVEDSALISDSILGTNSRVRSSKEDPTKLSYYVFIGDDSEIGKGSEITNNTFVPPKGKVEPGSKLSRISL